MNNCNCKPKNYQISLGCCQPVLGPVEAYYTKWEIDRMIEQIEESGCCITEEEVDEKISAATSGSATQEWVQEQGYITGVDLSNYATLDDIPDMDDYALKTDIPSLSGYATEQWVEDKHYISGVDLSDYVTFDDLPSLSGYASQEWVINQNYATNSELIQYVTNLQNQIDSLKAQISGCCGSSGETITRWITMTGENDYTCSGTTKMTKEAEQQSTDGIHWTDTGNYRTGSTVLEANSSDCGYKQQVKMYSVLYNNVEKIIECNSSTTLTSGETKNSTYKSIEIGECVTVIGANAFVNQTSLANVSIPGNVTEIGSLAFGNCGSIKTLTLNEGLITIGVDAFAHCIGLSSVTIPNSVVTIEGCAFYVNNLKTVTIGSGITSIGNSAFGKTSGATPYESVTILATTPPTVNASYREFGNTCPIYVPAGSVDAYKNASGWRLYGDRIQAIP